MTKIVERVADSRASPPLILQRHSYYQFGSLFLRRRTPYFSSFTRIVFLSHQSAKPTQQCLWSREIRDLLEPSVADLLRLCRQTAALCVIEPGTFAVDFFQHTNLLPLILDYGLLFPVNPPGETEENKFGRFHSSI